MSIPQASSFRIFRIVLLGPPASGKGTQGKQLAKGLGLGYLSTGALLREQVENETELGKSAAPILARGEYLPDSLMCQILAEWLERQTGGWVLDGFPRSVPQAEFLNQWLLEHDLTLDRAVVLEVPFAELLERIRNRVECPECRWSGQKSQAVGENLCPVCGTSLTHRTDDTEENFTRRHEEFVRLTLPVVSHYNNIGVLTRCDATAPLEQVSASLLGKFQQASHD